MTFDSFRLGEIHAAGTDVKRKIAAIMAADVVGYSRMISEDEEETLRRLISYREIFADFVGRADGRIFNTAGDAVLAEFPSAVDALRAAIEIQESIRTRNLAYPASRHMRFRIGMTIGDVVERDGDLLGDGVNVAARLEGLAEPGGICISRSVHEQVSNKLSISFRDIGPQSVKNIPNQIHAYQVPLLNAEPSPPAGAPTPAKAPDQTRLKVLASVLAVAVLGSILLVSRPPVHINSPVKAPTASVPDTDVKTVPPPAPVPSSIVPPVQAPSRADADDTVKPDAPTPAAPVQPVPDDSHPDARQEPSAPDPEPAQPSQSSPPVAAEQGSPSIPPPAPQNPQIAEGGDEKDAVTDPIALDEIKELLFEQNFNPGEAGTPAMTDAIHAFEEKAGLPIKDQPDKLLLRTLREARSLRPWGSIAFAEETKTWGMSWASPTRRIALAVARARCGSAQCLHQVSFYGRSCGAFALSPVSWSITLGNDDAQARQSALQNCGQRGSVCRIIGAVCADGTGR